MAQPEFSLTVVAAGSGEVREFPLSAADRETLVAGMNSGDGRLAAVWTEVGGPTRFVVRAGVGPWPPPEAGAPAGPQSWAREDAAGPRDKVRFRVITSNPWMTVEQGYLQPGQLDF